MSDQKGETTRVSDRALEMVMRDVLDGMIELSLEAAFAQNGSEFEIIDIALTGRGTAGPGRGAANATGQAEILPFPALRRAAG